VNRQVRQWLEQVAHRRRHRETNQTPEERLQPEALRAVPAITPDYRDVAEALVHKDLRISFDGNRYCVPPRYVGRQLTIKADSSAVTVYDQHQETVSYARCWQRGQTLGGRRFNKKKFGRRAAGQRSGWLNSAWSPCSLQPANPTYAVWPTPTVALPDKSASCLRSFENMGQTPLLLRSAKLMPLARLVPTTSRTSFANNRRAVRSNPRCASKILC